MTQVSVAPQPMPSIAPSQAAAAPGASADAATSAEGTADFAAVLKAQIAQPAKAGAETEIFAALLPTQAQETGEDALPADAMAVAPDLASLLPALSGLMQQTAPQATDNPESAAAETAGAAPDLAAATSLPTVVSAQIQPVRTDEDGGESGLPALQTTQPAAGPAVQPAQAESIAAAAAAQQMPAAAAEHANPVATAHAAAPLVHATSTADAPSTVRVDTPVGGRGWDAEVGQKIVLLANRQDGRAELVLTPPQLGKLEITISVSGDQTSAAFVSASPAAREALEQALPRLREILAEAGITLGQASVNAESPRQDKDGSSTPQRAGEGHGRGSEMAGASAPTQWLRRSEGLIDTFA